MAELTVDGLGELTSPAANDEIGIWDVSAAQYMRIRRDTLVGGTITGGGTIATGGYTLTAPATGTVALRGADNAFSSDQSIAKANPQLTLSPSSGYGQAAISDADNGSSIGGRVLVGRNNNASTPAAGHVRLTNLSGGAYRIWPDASGVLRIWTGDPTNANDTSGTVVGAQTSMAEAKHILAELSPIVDVLERIAAGADAVRRFTYRSGAFNSQMFEGVVVDCAPEYGLDRDDAHPAGRSLNEINIIGDLLRAVAWLAERVAVLEK